MAKITCHPMRLRPASSKGAAETVWQPLNEMNHRVSKLLSHLRDVVLRGFSFDSAAPWGSVWALVWTEDLKCQVQLRVTGLPVCRIKMGRVLEWL